MINKEKYLTKEEEEYVKINIQNQIDSLKEFIGKNQVIKKLEKTSIVKEGDDNE